MNSNNSNSTTTVTRSYDFIMAMLSIESLSFYLILFILYLFLLFLSNCERNREMMWRDMKPEFNENHIFYLVFVLSFSFRSFFFFIHCGPVGAFKKKIKYSKNGRQITSIWSIWYRKKIHIDDHCFYYFIVYDWIVIQRLFKLKRKIAQMNHAVV